MSPVAQAVRQRADHVVHGYDGVQVVTVKVSAGDQSTAITIAGVQRQGARVHPASLPCRRCREAVAPC